MLMAHSHILGFPSIGANRQMKKAVEAYWREEISIAELEAVGNEIEEESWRYQAEAGLDYITVGDFSWYDHYLLDTSALLGVVPKRFNQAENGKLDINTIFCMARGKAPKVKDATACEMTKWFNTNYHYIVPEFTADQNFKLSTDYLFNSVNRAQKLGYQVKPTVLGPLSFLWLGKTKEGNFNKLQLLKKLAPVYQQIIDRFKANNIEWLQIDEPILVLDLPKEWQDAFTQVYQQLNFGSVKCLLATYFGELEDNFSCIENTNVAGIHLDFSKDPQRLVEIAKQFPKDKILSAGVINGRNIWKGDLTKILKILQSTKEILKDRLWVSSSCSLLHVPVNLDREKPELKAWLSFAKEKIAEIALLAKILNSNEKEFSQQLADNNAAVESHRNSEKVHNAAVKQRVAQLTPAFSQRKNAYKQRAVLQRKKLNLPILPTTTIGSFPQTKEIRSIRQDFKSGKISETVYTQKIQREIAEVIKRQEELDLDVLVHGESERNDMVEYFGEWLNGFAFTKNGWVQSYGSRCVKPPIIYGDVSRPNAITVDWIQYAQQLTPRPVKGMLTGPVTILAWSFVRDDQPLSATALQIALALRDEVADLEKSGIKVIQIDEPAFREALPLRKNDWQDYLKWAVNCFRVASSVVKDETQIHTHMCYSEFNDIIEAIADLDADVITIENSRSDMELLKAFEHFAYPNEIGPGVYDIHSPLIPEVETIAAQLEKAARFVPASRLWVNPDCGLKTRGWAEVTAALTNMVHAAKVCRKKLAEVNAENLV
jgi:5-methyltetrahydropteroyltriglutamate--homocysteine methyltransferase